MAKRAEDAVIRVRGLSVGFGEKLVLDHLDLDVYRGEVLGFVGGSGSGKSVLMRTIIGLLPKRSGQIEVFGTDVDSITQAEMQKIEQRWGILFQHGALFSSLTVRQNIQFPIREFLGVSERLLDEITVAKLEMVGLAPDVQQKFPAELSGGMTKRVALARALALDPEVVFLDEPTSGLDPVGRRLVRDIIHELRSKGTTVFLNSHFLSEVEITCDRVAFIKHGEVVRVSDLKTLVAERGETGVAIRAGGLTAETLDGLSQWGRNVRADGEHVTLTVSSDAALPSLTRYLVERGAEVYAVTPQHLSLEELFIQIVGTDGGL